MVVLAIFHYDGGKTSLTSPECLPLKGKAETGFVKQEILLPTPCFTFKMGKVSFGFWWWSFSMPNLFPQPVRGKSPLGGNTQQPSQDILLLSSDGRYFRFSFKSRYPLYSRYLGYSRHTIGVLDILDNKCSGKYCCLTTRLTLSFSRPFRVNRPLATLLNIRIKCIVLFCSDIYVDVYF